MNETFEKWLGELTGDSLSDKDVERSLRYAKDLEQGLVQIRKQSQGVGVFGSARIPEDSKWYKDAYKLGKLLAENGHTVITGGGPSMMEAANRGCFEAGGRSVGLNITLDHEQHANPYLTDTIEFRYFFARKVMLTFASKVYVFFPGGFGTMDEFSEILVLMQERKMPIMPMFLYGKSFWTPLDRFYKNKMEKALKTINPKDRKIYKITDDLNEIVRAANKVGHQSIHENLYESFSSQQKPKPKI